MSTYMKMRLYCKSCKKHYLVDVLTSTSSFMIELDPKLKKKAQAGTLFKNFCPVCNSELEHKEDEEY